MPRGKQPISGLLADVLGLRPGHDRAFSGSSKAGATSQCRDGQAGTLCERTTSKHGWNRFSDGRRDKARIAQGCNGFSADTLCVLKLFLLGLERIALPAIGNLVRLVEADSSILKSLAGAATCGYVCKANCRLWNSHHALGDDRS